MTELSFNTGRRSFNINGVVEVSFNDTDASFVEKLYGLFRKLDEQQESYKAGIDKCSGEEIFSRMRELDAGMRKDINELFAKDVCSPLFGDMNVFAIADGLPLWANLLLAIMDQIDSAVTREQKATNPRVQKYVAKWQRK